MKLYHELGIMNTNHIDELRFYSRELIREFGFLNEDNPESGLNFAQMHLLLECERYGVMDQGKLARNLRVNKSYISRLVKSLMAKGYLVFCELENDKRNKPVAITPLGSIEVNRINQQARKQVQAALQYLTPEEQALVSHGLKLYSCALKKSRNLHEIVIRPIEKKDNEPLCALIKTVLSEFGANQPGFAYADVETTSMFEHYQDSGSVYLVAEKSGKLLGGVGIAPLKGGSPEICELRKMYLVRDARGLGLGNELFHCALIKAKQVYKAIYLETLAQMTQAIALYRKLGFELLSQPLGDTGHYRCDTWMLKKISETEL